MAHEEHQARYRTRLDLRRRGGIGNLAQGPEILTHGVRTRLVAWPATGYQTQAVHVLTLSRGEESKVWAYGLAEQAMLCHKGRGEVLLRGEWVEMRAGDLAYVPEGVPRALRNRGHDDFVLVTQITPPQFDLYAPSGFYDARMGVMNDPATDKARLNAEPVDYSTDNEMEFHDSSPHLRAWNLSPEEVRRGGALFNVYMGAPFSGIGVETMRLVLWPGAGTRLVGFNFASWPGDVPEVSHTHPVSDECLVLWAGRAQTWMGEGWLDLDVNDCILAPAGVYHGTRNHRDCLYGGFASPPQLDLLMNTPYYDGGLFLSPASVRLEAPAFRST